MNKIEYVSGFLFNENKNKVVLVIKNRPDFQRGKINAVGGKIEENESPIKAITREFWEETGLYFTNWEKFCEFERKSCILHFFRGTYSNIDEVKTKTDEKIIVLDLNYIDVFDRLPNFDWVFKMALSEGVHKVTEV